MEDFFDKIQKLSDKHLRDMAGMCAGTALLLLAAVFIADGGVSSLNTFVAVNGVTPSSQTSSVFHSNTNSSSEVGLASLQDNVAPGTPVTWVWNAGTYGGNTWSQACFGSQNSNYECNLSTSQPIWPLSSGSGNVDWALNGDGYYGVSGGITPVGYGVPGGRLVIDAPSTPGTYTYYMCSYWIAHKYGSAYTCATNTLTVVPPAPPPPPTPTTITSFTANPPSVTSGNSSTLAWTGVKGTYYQACDLRGGQWGNGTWFSALPGSIATNPLTTTTTYNISCVDTNGVATGWNPGTVVVTAPPPPPSCSNGLNINNYPSCACPANQTQSGSSCVAISCPSGYTGTYPNCVAPPPTCSNGLSYGSYGPSCTCPSGQIQSGSLCVTPPPVTCQNGLANSYAPGCTCPSGQIQSGSSCVQQGVINSLTANPSRVHRGDTTTISWGTSGMNACVLSSLTSAGTTGLSSALSSSLQFTINSKTVYTLSCSDISGAAYSSSVTVNLIPQTTEQ